MTLTTKPLEKTYSISENKTYWLFGIRMHLISWHANLPNHKPDL